MFHYNPFGYLLIFKSETGVYFKERIFSLKKWIWARKRNYTREQSFEIAFLYDVK